MSYGAIPIADGSGGLKAYLKTIGRFPMLKPEEEYLLAKRFQDHGDTEAAHKLVTSHLRLVAKVAIGYRHYGLPVSDLISEGSVGLMRAVRKFDPEKGFRLATYALWWIKAAINEYILNSWSLVKVGTVAAQKKLFFNLRRLKSRLGVYEDGDMAPEVVTRIAEELNVSESDVQDMNRRMAGSDISLNITVFDDHERERQDLIVDERPDQEALYGEAEEARYGRRLLQDALTTLNDRERRIIEQRRLVPEPLTLEELAGQFGISRERVRQIENRAFQKLQTRVRAAAAPG